jgi:hypothetical protein
VRIVKEGGIRLRSNDLKDRVDLINVLRIRRDGRGVFHVKGFQGQLQEAWLRVAPVIREGTKSGTVGLMGRNLSHNIGSHALYWVEQQEPDEEKSRFYRHLRERMELLAGFATSMPLSTTTIPLRELETELKSNQLLWKTIAKSEEVDDVKFEFEGTDCLVALPGGVIGKQAFCTIVENVVRDCAKFARPGRVIPIKIRAEDAPGHPDHVRITIRELCRDCQTSLSTVSRALASLQIADDVGRLVQEHWGIKERFICAALLRGFRLENLPADEPSVLSIGHEKGSDGKQWLAWTFYLLKPKDILWIDGNATPPPHAEGLELHDPAWLANSIRDPAALRHRFVVLGANQVEGMDADTLISKLPNRVLAREVCRSLKVPPIEIDEETSPLTCAYRCWVRRFIMAGRKMPAIVIADAWPQQFDQRASRTDRNGVPAVFYWPAQHMDSWLERWGAQLGAPIALFDRHGAEVDWVEQHGTLLYEPHNVNDNVRSVVDMSHLMRLTAQDLELLALRLAEAALTRILIVDERLDAASGRKEYRGDSPRKSGDRWSCSYKKLFAWKGITMAGSEYGGREIPDEELLLQSMAPGEFDFAVVHRGILDKLRSVHHTDTNELCGRLQDRVTRLVVHSGRMGMQDLPGRVNFLPLTAVTAWLDQNYSKLQIVDELNMLRRVG